MDKKTTSIVSYITLIGWIIAYCAGDREGAKFYLNQSLVLTIANVVLSVAARVGAGTIVATIAGILSLVLFVFWIIGLVHAIKQDDQQIPLIGGIEILK